MKQQKQEKRSKCSLHKNKYLLNTCYHAISVQFGLMLPIFVQQNVSDVIMTYQGIIVYIMIDQINELPEDGQKSSPETSRFTENKWISRKNQNKLYLLHLIDILNDLLLTEYLEHSLSRTFLMIPQEFEIADVDCT